jgi:hypothetical protein
MATETTFDTAAANADAKVAEKELLKALEDPNLAPGIRFVGAWQLKHFMATGHKRIGRILVNIGKAVVRKVD